jgi:hypothetical protein
MNKYKKHMSVGLLLVALAIFGYALAGINGANWNSTGVDGTNTNNTTNYALAQVSGTATTTQTSGWLLLNGQQAVQVEFVTSSFLGSYSIQVSNDQTHTHTVVRDNCVSGQAGAQTLYWSYIINGGWKYVRAVAAPNGSNTGTLNIYARTFAEDATRNLKEGVSNRSSSELVANANYATPGSGTVEYKVPAGAKGVMFTQDLTALSASATLIGTYYSKDPVSGKIVSLNAAVTTGAGAASTGTQRVYVGAFPQYTPSAGTILVPLPANQDLVYVWSAGGTPATITFSESAVPFF